MRKTIVFIGPLLLFFAAGGQVLAQSCPANSHLDSKVLKGGTTTVSCTCDVGFVRTGGKCVSKQKGGWICNSAAGCPGTIQITVPFGPARGATQALAAAAAMKLCTDWTGLCCKVTTCNPAP
jgi:hypothetical protein